jgi:hypothetical protein
MYQNFDNLFLILSPIIKKNIMTQSIKMMFLFDILIIKFIFDLTRNLPSNAITFILITATRTAVVYLPYGKGKDALCLTKYHAMKTYSVLN